jgi:hypothetical protein
MMGFKENFIEILNYFVKSSATKKEYLVDVMENLDKVFCQSIPVYTTHLRPFNVDNGTLAFEGTNALYNIAAKVAAKINDTRLRMYRKSKPKNKLLFDLQSYVNEIYKELELTLTGKKGATRQLFGARYNFSSRSIIISGPALRTDQVKLSYHGLVTLLEQRIKNILHTTFNIPYNEAHKIWEKAQVRKDQMVWNIIESIIKSYPNGLPVLINRNPTINYGSIMQMYCIGINDNHCMSLSLQVLPFLAADFDGDTLNILSLINNDFIERCEIVFNPKNALYISTNDGKFDNRINQSKSRIINYNSFVSLGRDAYTKEESDYIRSLALVK